jgi:hypothetical protein
MGWSLAAAWMIVAGSVLLTIGTGAQAWANLSEYRDLISRLPEEASLALVRGWLRFFILTSSGLPVVAAAAALSAAAALVKPEDTERLARLARLTAVWTVLMVGSALVLAAAIIQLIIGHTS